MSKEFLTPTEFRAALLAVADAIIAAEPYLSEADRNLGDGDHGLGMQRGMLAVKEKLGAQESSMPLDKLCQATGMAMMSSMGGASGVIFATLFMSGGKALAAHENLTGAAYAAFLRGAAEGVMARGKAKAGDKTMVDALLPAADAAEGASTITEAAQAALRGGIEGREASKAMIAQFGRAKSLGEGAIGFPDAGACSVVIILETLAQHAQG